MQNKICLVTGATAGIGEETARALAAMGATVIIVGRSPERCEATVARIRAQTGNANVEAMVADLSLLREVQRLAEAFTRKYDRLDILVNNAGAMFTSRQITAEGFEVTLALNHLNYFLLTSLLLDTLKASAPARIVNVASDAHQMTKGITFEELERQRGFSLASAYPQSKLANILFTYELARRLEGTGVTANVLHPGVVASNFGLNNGWWFRPIRALLNRFSISVEEGAATSVHVATSPTLEGVTGKYFEKSQAATSSPSSYDEAAARRLWELSERWVAETLAAPVAAL